MSPFNLENAISAVLAPYLRAWTDEKEAGDPEFDSCATVEELAAFLSHKLVWGVIDDAMLEEREETRAEAND